MRDKAQEILINTLSQNEQMLIEEIETLPNRLIDAMEEYAAILVDKERAKHEFSK
jgi:hypothetical protein